MTKRTKKAPAPKSAFDTFIETITGRVAKITALIAAVGGLAVAVLSQSQSFMELLVKAQLYAPPPCVEVFSKKFPTSVKLSEWEDTKVELSGRNNCATDLGLYVAFRRDSRNDRLFMVTARHADFPECKALSSDTVPRCWDAKKPVRVGKGEWTYDVPLPNLERLANPRRVEKILMSWSLHDYDAPTKPAIVTDLARIEIQNDAHNE